MKKILLLLLFLSLESVNASWLLPQANLKLSSTRLEFGQELTLDASDSLNSQNLKYGLYYRFKPDRNSSWTEFSHYPIFKYTPNSLGTKTAYLEVKDLEKNYTKVSIADYKVIMPIERNVRIKILNRGDLKIGEEVFFQLDFIVPNNTDKQNITSRWDFDGDGVFDTKLQNIQTVSHIFEKAETITPKVEVVFPTGEKVIVKGFEPPHNPKNRNKLTQNEFGKLKILPATILPPTVNISPSYRVYTENTKIKFDASKTKTTPHSWIEFQFDGEPTKLSPEKFITKKFKSAGTHNVITRHCYNHHRPVCAETTTQIHVKKDPTNFSAKISIYDLNGYNVSQNTTAYSNYNKFKAGKKLKFQATLTALYSTAKHFEYRWDFDGDGNFDTPFSKKPYAEYTFARAGNYKTCLQVKNEFTREDKALVSDFKILEIVNNQKPLGYFKFQKLTRSPHEDPQNPQIFVGDTVQIIPVLQDEDDYPTQLSVRFDIDNDGIWETNFAYNYGFKWKVKESGKFRGKMQVKDQNGVTRTITQTYFVEKSPKPKIKIQVSKKTGAVGEVFSISARNSTGNKLKYTWHIPERNDLVNSWVDLVNISFKTKGKKTISLIITDSMGQKDWVEFPVFVE